MLTGKGMTEMIFPIGKNTGDVGAWYVGGRVELQLRDPVPGNPPLMSWETIYLTVDQATRLADCMGYVLDQIAGTEQGEGDQ